jgi:hypothetical protein
MKFTNRNYGETNEFATFPQWMLALL